MVTLRVPNIMTRVMRWHDFGTGREAGRSEYREYSQGSRQCHGPKFAPAPGLGGGAPTPPWGCSHNGRSLCRAACSCAPASVSRSVVRDGAPGGVFARWWYGASAAAPANGPAANESQPPRYELHHPSRDQSVLAATHTCPIVLGTLNRRRARVRADEAWLNDRRSGRGHMKLATGPGPSYLPLNR